MSGLDTWDPEQDGPNANTAGWVSLITGALALLVVGIGIGAAMG